jgi:hypothetical protein
MRVAIERASASIFCLHQVAHRDILCREIDDRLITRFSKHLCPCAGRKNKLAELRDSISRIMTSLKNPLLITIIFFV